MKLLVLSCQWCQCKSSRTLALPLDWSLAELHAALQIAFGWEGEHLYSFTAPDGTTWAEPDDDFWGNFGGGNDLEPEKTTLFDVFSRTKARLDYEYDFGDSNVVRITSKKLVDGDGPACLEASGLMAEEDSAGFGYADGIASILQAGPKDEAYEDLASWLEIDSPKDAKAWVADHTADAAAITAALATVRPAKKKKRSRR